MNDHLMLYSGRVDDGYGFWCPDCSRSIKVTTNPTAKVVLFGGNTQVSHGLKLAGLKFKVGAVYRGKSITDEDLRFLHDAEIDW